MPLYPPIPIADPTTGSYTYTDAEGVERIAYDPTFDPTTNEAVGQTQDWELTLAERLLFRHVLLPCTELTMTGDLTLTNDSATYQFLNPNSADRNVTMPTEFAGLNFLIHNTGSANTLTVKDSGSSTITTVAFGTVKTFIYSGSAWRYF